jgi:hypothetical protein
VAFGIHVLDIYESEVDVLHHFKENIPAHVRARLDSGMDLQCPATLQDFMQESMLHQWVATREGNATTGPPIAEIPSQNLDEFIYGIVLDALFEDTVRAGGCAFECPAVPANLQVDVMPAIRIEVDGAARACIPACPAALLPFAQVFRIHQVLVDDPALRVRAPAALERTTRQEDVRPASRSVVNRKALLDP